MKWLFAKLKNTEIKIISIIFIAVWLLLVLFYYDTASYSNKEELEVLECTNYTGGTAWEIQDRRIECRNRAEHYLELVEALKQAETISRCNQLENKNSCEGLAQNQ